MPTLREIIWEKYFAPLDDRTDANKDVQGKGTMRRFNETIASDADLLLELVADVLINTVQPQTIEERFLPFREEHLGNNIEPFLLSADVAMRRRVLRHWHRLVSERGTEKGLLKLFRWLGFTAASTVTEFFIDGWDSDTWDGDILTNWDMGRCATCTPYDVALVGSMPIDESLWFGIVSAILFHQPINADLRTLTYEQLPNPPIQLYPLATTGSYQTAKNGVHSPIISGGGTTAWSFDASLPFGAAGGLQFGYSPSYTYPNGDTKTVGYYVYDDTGVAVLDFGGEDIVGVFDSSAFLNCTEWDFSDNPLLTSVTFPIAITPDIDIFAMRAVPLVTALNLTPFAAMGGEIDLSGNPQLTTLTFNPVKSTAKTVLFDGRGIGLAALDLEPLTLFDGCSVLIDSAASVIKASMATSLNFGQLDVISASYCSALTTLDISALRGSIERIDVTGCAVLTSLNVGTGFARTGASEVQGAGAISLGGSLDWTALPVKTAVILSGAAITDILHATDTSAIANYNLSNCVNLVYFALTPLEGLLTGNDSTVRLNDCGLSSGDVDSFLADILSVLTTRGEVAPGSYTGRTVYIGGTNAAPTGAGLATVATLLTLGVTVYHT